MPVPVTTLRLTLLRCALPLGLKLRMLDELARVTAEGFATAAPEWPGRSFKVRLAAYAGFTSAEAGRLVAGGDAVVMETAEERLRRGAADLGAGVRRRLGLRRPQEALEAWKLLYHQIGIEVTGGLGGEIMVTRCFFADHYTEPVCRVIGALDDGLADGLFGGATLEFGERITGGSPCCRAVLRLAGPQG